MADGVVDRLETIEIQEEHADRIGVRLLADQAFQGLEHSPTVEQSGQGVVRCLVGELFVRECQLRIGLGELDLIAFDLGQQVFAGLLEQGRGASGSAQGRVHDGQRRCIEQPQHRHAAQADIGRRRQRGGRQRCHRDQHAGEHVAAPDRHHGRHRTRGRGEHGEQHDHLFGRCAGDPRRHAEHHTHPTETEAQEDDDPMRSRRIAGALALGVAVTSECREAGNDQERGQHGCADPPLQPKRIVLLAGQHADQDGEGDEPERDDGGVGDDRDQGALT